MFTSYRIDLWNGIKKYTIWCEDGLSLVIYLVQWSFTVLEKILAWFFSQSELDKIVFEGES